MVNICMYNHPSKLFTGEDHKEVVVLMLAQCTKHGCLCRGMMQAWFMWCIKNDTTMLINGILPLDSRVDAS
jgi:hypothetical protein